MIQAAYQTAKKSLRKCYTDKGIVAGTTHFSDYWARDGLFASMGAVDIGDYEQAKKELQLMLDNQKEDGQLPLRIGVKNIIFNLLGFKSAEKTAVYVEDKKGNIPKDQNAIFIIALSYYLQKTNDKEFIKNNFEKIKKAIDWYKTEDLVEEDWYCSWDDCIRKKGKTIYTNVLYCKALHEFDFIAKVAGEKTEYHKKAKTVKEKINYLFWNGNYYTDWIDEEKHDYFSVAGNMLAIIFDIADREKAFKIIYNVEKNKLDEGFAIKNVVPEYDKKDKSLFLSIFGMGDYQDGFYWLWVSCLYIMARHKTDFDYKTRIESLAKKINEYQNIYEVYTPEGKPVKRFFYNSEKDFAWSSSLFIHMIHETKTF
jgi:glycogen debranching enzyme